MNIPERAHFCNTVEGFASLIMFGIKGMYLFFIGLSASDVHFKANLKYHKNEAALKLTIIKVVMKREKPLAVCDSHLGLILGNVLTGISITGPTITP